MYGGVKVKIHIFLALEPDEIVKITSFWNLIPCTFGRQVQVLLDLCDSFVKKKSQKVKSHKPNIRQYCTEGFLIPSNSVTVVDAQKRLCG
jgi:hypothetical protein